MVCYDKHESKPQVPVSVVSLYSSISTVSYIDEPGHHDDNPRPTVQMENTYQLGEPDLNLTFLRFQTLR